jgi:hypothetical protein
MFMVGMAGSPRVLPFQDNPIWQIMAKYAIDRSERPYNAGVTIKPDGTRAGRELLCNRRNPGGIPLVERAATTPWVVFPGFEFFWFCTMNPPEPYRKKRIHCSRMESFQHPRP